MTDAQAVVNPSYTCKCSAHIVWLVAIRVHMIQQDWLTLKVYKNYSLFEVKANLAA